MRELAYARLPSIDSVSTPTRSIVNAVSTPRVRTRSTFCTVLTLGNTNTFTWFQIVSRTSSWNSETRTRPNAGVYSTLRSSASDTSGARVGSLTEICVDETVPMNSSATVGKRTPRPALQRTCQSESGLNGSEHV